MIFSEIIESEATKAIFSKLVNGVYSKCSQIVKAWNNSAPQNNERLLLNLSTEEQLFRRLETIMTENYNWSKDINFRDLQSKKNLLDNFIHIDFFLSPISTHLETESEDKQSLSDLIKGCEDHLIILGGPGAGKTTVTKFITLEGFEKKPMFSGFSYTLPLLIRLRELNSMNILDDFFWSLLIFLGIDLDVEYNRRTEKNESFKIVSDTDKAKLLPTTMQLATEIIDSLNIVLILDGLDELAGDRFVQSTIKGVRHLCLSLKNSKIILTSRTGEYYSAIDNATTVEIAPLSKEQIEHFVEKWMANKEKSVRFLSQLSDSPYADTAIRPINLAHLCALFIRYREIPEKPRTVYEKIVMLLIEEWDLQRDIKRKSNFGSFTPIRKREFLSALSFELTKKFKTSIFSKAQFNSAYEDISRNFDLEKDKGFDVVSEIESHTGLFVQSGYNKYEFSHKSLQEYLTADYLVRYPRLMRLSEKAMHMPNEYAIAISLSSNPSSTLYDLLFDDGPNVLPGFTSFLRNLTLRIIIEKPDFNSSPYTASAVARIGTLLRFSKETAEDLRQLLYSHPNIERSFRSLKHYFQPCGPINSLPSINNEQIHSFKEFTKFDEEHIRSHEVIDLNADMYRLFCKTNMDVS